MSYSFLHEDKKYISNSLLQIHFIHSKAIIYTQSSKKYAFKMANSYNCKVQDNKNKKQPHVRLDYCNAWIFCRQMLCELQPTKERQSSLLKTIPLYHI